MQVTQILAPTTLITALMIYYGYVATYARFQYFGIALEAMDLTVQELILNGTETMWVPLTTVLLLVLVSVGIHVAHLRLIELGRWPRPVWAAGVAMMAGGLALLIRAVVGVVVPEVARAETAGVTPLCLSLGTLLIAYGGYVVMRTWSRPRWVSVLAVVTTVSLVISGVVWTTNSFASAFGRGLGITISRNLTRYPEAVIDTTERLTLVVGPERMERLPAAKGEKFKYRYRGMRLLIEAGGRLFLVPEKWTSSSGTLVLPYSADVRVQFLPGD